MILADHELSVSIYLWFAYDLQDLHVCVMRQRLISLSMLALYMVALKYTITYLLTLYDRQSSEPFFTWRRSWYEIYDI